MLILLLAIHVFGALFWVGGMAFAYTMLRPAAGALEAPVRLTLWRNVFNRFLPWVGVSIVALGGIVTGNMMTAHTLFGRRTFAELRGERGVFEAGLSLGMPRRLAIGLVIDRLAGEALVPNIDQTKTVGLVTLPGAFIGVLLGGGSPLQAGAAQVLVLIGIMAGQAITVSVAAELVRRVRIVPADLVSILHR